MNTFSSINEKISNTISSLVQKLRGEPTSQRPRHNLNSSFTHPAFTNHSRNLSQSHSFSPKSGPSSGVLSNSLQLRQIGTASLDPAIKSVERPYMVFVYSQKFKVEGQGTYELKITNVINPYTMKATPLQPSLVNPTYLMTQGIGNNKKSLTLDEDQIPQLIMQQNNLKMSNNGSRDNDQVNDTEEDAGEDNTRRSMPLSKNQQSNLLSKSKNSQKFKTFGGAQVRLLACQRRVVNYKRNKGDQQPQIRQLQSSDQLLLNQNKRELTTAQLEQKRKETAVKFLRKIFLNKVRSHMKDLKGNAWGYYNFRQQKKLRSSLQLFKVLSHLNEKMKQNKFQAFSKIKEQYLTNSSQQQDSQGSYKNSSKDNSNDMISNNKKLSSNKLVSHTPTTAAQSVIHQQKISKQQIQGAKILAYILEQKLLDRKLSFWLPFRANQARRKTIMKDLKINFADKVFDREALEKELAQKFNKIELRKIDDNLSFSHQEESKADNLLDEPRFKQINTNESFDDIFDPIQNMTELNLTAIPQTQNMKNMDESYAADFFNDFQFLNTTRSKFGLPQMPSAIPEKKEEDETNGDLSAFGLKHYDTTSYIATEEEYKQVKMENNLVTLNKDIEMVNEEIEQIKRLLFEQDGDDEDNEDDLDQAEQLALQKKLTINTGNKMRKFRTEEELIDYYEMKALDPFADGLNEQDDEDESYVQDRKKKVRPTNNRKRSDSLKKNIRKYEKMNRRNLNDSRENDFEGMDEFNVTEIE